MEQMKVYHDQELELWKTRATMLQKERQTFYNTALKTKLPNPSNVVSSEPDLEVDDSNQLVNICLLHSMTQTQQQLSPQSLDADDILITEIEALLGETDQNDSENLDTVLEDLSQSLLLKLNVQPE